MLVVIEGGDGSGKTILTSQLSKLGYKCGKLSYNESTDEKWLELAKEPLFITDRSFITDVVYRLRDGKEPQTTINGQIDVINKGLMIVLCDTPTSFVDGINRGEDNIVSEKDANLIKQIYRIVCSYYNMMFNIPLYVYNWKTDNINSIVNFIGKPR